MIIINLLSKDSPEFKQARKKALARSRSKKWRLENPEKAQEQNRVYRDPIRDRKRTLMKYGLTVYQYDRMWLEQRGKCLGCGIWFSPGIIHGGASGEVLHVDHDHKSGTVRGLLCTNCNRTLGYAKDNPAILRALADYLEK